MARVPPRYVGTGRSDHGTSPHFSIRGKDMRVVLCGLLVAQALWGSRQLPAAESRPNVLMIAVDDLRPELGCYGKSTHQVPEYRRLREVGRCFSAGLLRPGRLQSLTGQPTDRETPRHHPRLGSRDSDAHDRARCRDVAAALQGSGVLHAGRRQDLPQYISRSKIVDDCPAFAEANQGLFRCEPAAFGRLSGENASGGKIGAADRKNARTGHGR